MVARAYIGGGDPVAPPNGRQVFFYFQGPYCEFEKKNSLKACRPMGGATGGIFEIFQNGHIFLKFLFLKNIKKKKPRERRSGVI